MRVAVVGAGAAGLSCARSLARAGASPTLFEKSRGPGGRMSSRREGELAFDHGAQSFTVRSPLGQSLVAEALEAGALAPWAARCGRLRGGLVEREHSTQTRYVGVPRMSAFTRHLADGLDLRAGLRVARVEARGGALHLKADTGEDLGAFDRVALTTPPAQALPLLDASPRLAALAAAAELEPCLALMVHFDAPLPLDLDDARVEGSPLARAIRDSAKPGRAPGERWVLHASPAWSREHLEAPPEQAVAPLLAAFAEAAGRPLPPARARAHRWRYALALGPFAPPAAFDPDAGLGLAGDWLVEARVEAALVSGAALAARLLA